MKKTIENVDEVLDKMSDAVEEMVEDAGKTAKKVAARAKRQVKTAAEKAAPAAAEAKKAVRKTGKKVAAALIPEVYIQWNGVEVNMAELVEQAKADFKAQHDDLILSCRVYVKPQDGAAYYVINDTEGKIAL